MTINSTFDANALNQPAPPEINPEELVSFIKTVRPDGNIKLATIGQYGGPPLVNSFSIPEELQAVIEFCEDYKGRNLYYELNLANNPAARKSKESDISAIIGVVVDLDPDCSNSYEAGRDALMNEKLEEVSTFPVEPTLVIDSGNGLQVIYLLNEFSTDFERVKSLSKNLAIHFGGDTTYSIDHLFRLPGTWNYPNQKKLDKGYPSEPSQAISIINNGPHCSIEELENAIEWINSVSNEDIQFENTSTTEPGIAFRKLELLMKHNLKLRNRWIGDSSGLEDTSRSGMDFSMVSMLKQLGLTYEETHCIMLEYPHGKVAEKEADGYHQYFSTDVE